MWAQMTAHTRNVCMDYSDNISHVHPHRTLPLHDHGHRHGPQWQHGLRRQYSLGRQDWLLTTGYFSPTLHLQFHLSSYSSCSAHFSLPSLYHICTHCSGSCCRQTMRLVDLWMSTACPCGMARDVSLCVYRPHRPCCNRSVSGNLSPPVPPGMKTGRSLGVLFLPSCVAWQQCSLSWFCISYGNMPDID